MVYVISTAGYVPISRSHGESLGCVYRANTRVLEIIPSNKTCDAEDLVTVVTDHSHGGQTTYRANNVIVAPGTFPANHRAPFIFVMHAFVIIPFNV